MDEKRVDKIYWHSGFQGAVELEFRANKGDLEFDREHYLSKEPIRMDLLIIKVVNGARILNEIGHIFKRYNVFEYKSPDDGITIDDLFKTIGYACLYKGLGETVDAVPATELTVSLLREKKPIEFFNAVRRIGGIIEEGFPGIYYIKGISMIDTQLVIFEELDEKTHSSLRVLSKTLNVNDARIFLKNTEDINNPGDRDNMNAVLEVSILANRDIYQWLKREEFGMCEALKDLMKDEIDEAVTEAVTQAVTENDKKNAAETEKKVISLIEALMSSSHIDADKAMELLQIPTDERTGLKQKIEAKELQ
jgi:hypothetical protein